MSFISFFSKRYTYINFKYQSFYSMYKVLNRWQVNLRLFDHQLKEVSKLFVNLAVIVSNSSKTKKPPSMNLLLQALGIVNVGILYAKDSSHLLWFVTQFEFREYLQFISINSNPYSCNRLLEWARKWCSPSRSNRNRKFYRFTVFTYSYMELSRMRTEFLPHDFLWIFFRFSKGAVSGYIIAIRRGFFRRLLYTSIGGLGVASICYPKDAEHYWQQVLSESKTYATILYNFAYGGNENFSW